MLNMADIVIIGILLLGIGLGALLGVIKMVLSLFSSFMAVIITFFVQPLLLPVLEKYTPLYGKLVELIARNVDLTALADKLANPEASKALSASEGLELSPQILALLGKRLSKGDVLESIQMQISHNLAGIALQILSFFIGFVLVLIVFGVVSWLLSGVGKLPVIKEVNKAAGAVLGGLLSLLLIWIGMLALNYWFSTGQHLDILLLIKDSLVAKYFYQYNFLVYYLILLQ